MTLACVVTAKALENILTRPMDQGELKSKYRRLYELHLWNGMYLGLGYLGRRRSVPRRVAARIREFGSVNEIPLRSLLCA